MMGENVKKETVDYLPLGSVVILKGCLLYTSDAADEL